MGSIRTCVMLFVLALTLSLAATAAAQPLSGPEFIPLATPCRVLDTREGQPIQANEPFSLTIGGICGVEKACVVIVRVGGNRPHDYLPLCASISARASSAAVSSAVAANIFETCFGSA